MIYFSLVLTDGAEEWSPKRGLLRGLNCQKRNFRSGIKGNGRTVYPPNGAKPTLADARRANYRSTPFDRREMVVFFPGCGFIRAEPNDGYSFVWPSNLPTSSKAFHSR
jgi:hypothetical protein